MTTSPRRYAGSRYSERARSAGACGGSGVTFLGLTITVIVWRWHLWALRLVVSVLQAWYNNKTNNKDERLGMSKSKTKTVREPQAENRANWGPNESPRHCRKCQCTKTEVVSTRNFEHPARRVRYRKCLECLQRFSTLEIIKSTTL